MSELHPIKKKTIKGVDDEDEGDVVDYEDDLKLDELVVLRGRQFAVRFFKGFGSGLGLYTSIKIVSVLIRNPFRESLPKIRADFLATDCFRFATFLGLYPSIYDLVAELLVYYRGRRDDLNSALAGGIAGLSIVVEDRSRRRVYCLFAIARAVGTVVSILAKRGVIPTIPYSETALFCLCSSFLVYCSALKPQYLSTSYYRSILKWSRDYTDQKLTRLFREPGTKFITCTESGLHGHTCTYHALKDMVQSVPPFAKLYLPIHIAPILLFRPKTFLRRPVRVIISLLKNVALSTAFLATMTMLAKYVICLLRNFQFRPPPLSPWIPATAGLVCGLGVLFEREAKRKELSLFLVPHILSAVYMCAIERKLIVHIPHSSLFMYALAMVPVMHAYEQEPESLNLLVHSTLKFFVGKRKSSIERKERRTVSVI